MPVTSPLSDSIGTETGTGGSNPLGRITLSSSELTLLAKHWILRLVPELTLLRGRLPRWALLTAAAAGAVTARVGWRPELLADLLILAVLGPALSLIDMQVLRLPDRIVLPGAALLGILLSSAALAQGEPQRLVRAFEATLVVTLMLGLLAVLWPDTLGLGDVKVQGLLLAPLLAWGSWGELVAGLVVTMGIASAPGLWRLARGRRGGIFALGPYLFAGTTLTVLLY
ncbi:leader peptidase (prepilin peptidase)/N-methyltransferase [Streptacidiphilus sp. MAP12-16]|uniref:hypothetical protein n=1 Tax=Streptacidiphilus sp. MAP12-16 TaxID=3156300 RepID=UPI0035127244